jgi:hypothetical protein
MLQRPHNKLANRRDVVILLERERQKRYQRRLRAGITVVNMEVDADDIDLLLRLRWLAPQDAADKRAISKALKSMVKSIR